MEIYWRVKRNPGDRRVASNVHALVPARVIG
jgi:hypothetical protein